MQNLLKRSLLLLFIAATVACSKDEKNDNNTANNTPSTEKKVEGEWMMTEFNQSGDTESNGQTVSTHTATGSNFGGSLTFNADKTYKGDISYDVTIITDMGFMVDTTTTSLNGFMSSGTWEINADDDLVVSSSTGDSQTIEIISVTTNKLVLHMETSQTQTQGGVTATSNLNVDFVLEK